MPRQRPSSSGSLIALQAPINSGLGKATDTFPAAVISFAVGLAVLVAIAVVAGQIGEVSRRRATCAGTT